MKPRVITMSGLLAKSMLGAEMVIALLSGTFAVVNHSMHGTVITTAIFAVLAVAAVLVAVVMACLLWLVNLPTGDPA